VHASHSCRVSEATPSCHCCCSLAALHIAGAGNRMLGIWTSGFAVRCWKRCACGENQQELKWVLHRVLSWARLLGEQRG
jgi:hypothetical protein